jgi:hypothetical protein
MPARRVARTMVAGCILCEYSRNVRPVRPNSYPDASINGCYSRSACKQQEEYRSHLRNTRKTNKKFRARH